MTTKKIITPSLDEESQKTLKTTKLYTAVVNDQVIRIEASSQEEAENKLAEQIGANTPEPEEEAENKTN